VKEIVCLRGDVYGSRQNQNDNNVEKFHLHHPYQKQRWQDVTKNPKIF
jgi:hypothetical protein